MKRNKLIYSRWLRVLFLSFALLVGGGGWMAWGQESGRPIINLEFSKTARSHLKKMCVLRV